MSTPQPQQRQREPSPAEKAFMQKKAMEQQVLNQKLNQHVQTYPIQLLFPASISPLPEEKDFTAEASRDTAASVPASTASNGSTTISMDSASTKPLRTSSDFINYRLLETSGLNFTPDANEVTAATNETKNGNDMSTQSTLAQTTQALNHFVQDLQSTNCYDCVQVVLANQDNDEQVSNEAGGIRPKKLNVLLKEKNWYKLYIGGGIKHDHTTATTGSMGTTTFPKVQFESSASLINLTGLTDFTQCSYTVDQTSTPTLSLTHTRPLYSLFDTYNSNIGDTILNMNQGSKVGITFRADVDTLDYEHTRSSKDHIQSIGMKIANSTTHSSSINPSMSDDVYVGLDWSFAHRDVIPRRHTTSPFLCDASPDIIACGGSSWKHSLMTEYKMNGYYTDSKYNPTMGVDSYGGVELAGPPGDVGFLKCWAGGSVHVPLTGVDYDQDDNNNELQRSSGGLFDSLFPKGLSLHTSYSCGMIKSFTYGGLCMSSGDMTNISDRYYIGGPHQLRGFLPAGIGPRSDEVSAFE